MQQPTPKSVFVGWVDISPDDWIALGYTDKESWLEVVKWNNEAFQYEVRRLLRGVQLTGAKNRSDDDAAGHDLHVKFSNVMFDVESYRLYATAHLIDTRSKSEIAKVVRKHYRGGRFTVNNCLQGALKQLAEAVAAAVRTSWR